MTSPTAILDMIRRGQAPGARIAVVTAAASGSPMTVTVRFVEGGQTFQPLVFTHLPLPVAGSHCLIIPSDGGWVYAGAVADPAGVIDYRTVDVLIERNWHKAYDVNSAEWYWQQDWATLSPESRGDVMQGRWPPQAGGSDGSVPEIQPMTDYAHVLVHNVDAVLDAIAAATGTVHLVELVMQRTDYNDNGPVSPVMYGHEYGYDDTPDPATAPDWTPGFGPLRLAPFTRGQTARWVLPAEWTTALASGALAGIGFYSNRTADVMSTHSEELGGANARLVITYTAPTDLWE